MEARVSSGRTVEKLVSDKIATGTVGKILLYKPMQKYLEVDLSPLYKSFPEFSFDDAPQNANGEFPAVPYDIIFAPLYGFNGDKYRLGHGSGWYDRFLASQPQAIKIGVGLDIGRVYFTPEPHDVPMDQIVTESLTLT